MKFVIWGCGYRGKMLLKCIEPTRIEAYIDSDENLQGEKYQGIPIISYESYLSEYNNCFIIISPSVSPSVNTGIIARLKADGVNKYFLLERCPTELPYYEDIIPFEEMLSASVNYDKKRTFLIAGVNLFSIFLYEFLKKEGYKVHFYDDHNQVTLISEIKKDVSYSFIREYETRNADILVADRFLDKTNGFPFINATNFYRFPNLTKYRYNKIGKLAQRHKGKRCFVVATGPSLKIEDLDTIYANNELSISVNTVYNSFGLTKWRPDYLVVTDTGALHIYYDDLLKADVKYKVLADRQYDLWHSVDREDIIVFHMMQEYYEEEGPEFSSRMDIGAFYGGSVVYCALQLAVYMGFEEIYIIGADCEYKGNGRSEKDHFIPNYFNKDGAVGSLIPEKMFAAYRVARKYAEEHGVKIYNATRGGKLEVFERVDFDDLFQQ